MHSMKTVNHCDELLGLLHFDCAVQKTVRPNFLCHFQLVDNCRYIVFPVQLGFTTETSNVFIIFFHLTDMLACVDFWLTTC